MHPLYADGRNAPAARPVQPDRPDTVPRKRGSPPPAAAVDGDVDALASHPGREESSETND